MNIHNNQIFSHTKPFIKYLKDIFKNYFEEEVMVVKLKFLTVDSFFFYDI